MVSFDVVSAKFGLIIGIVHILRNFGCGGSFRFITIFHRGVSSIYYNITWGGQPNLLQYYMGSAKIITVMGGDSNLKVIVQRMFMYLGFCNYAFCCELCIIM